MKNTTHITEELAKLLVEVISEARANGNIDPERAEELLALEPHALVKKVMEDPGGALKGIVEVVVEEHPPSLESYKMGFEIVKGDPTGFRLDPGWYLESASQARKRQVIKNAPYYKPEKKSKRQRRQGPL